jgi:hypothetical protein
MTNVFAFNENSTHHVSCDPDTGVGGACNSQCEEQFNGMLPCESHASVPDYMRQVYAGFSGVSVATTALEMFCSDCGRTYYDDIVGHHGVGDGATCHMLEEPWNVTSDYAFYESVRAASRASPVRFAPAPGQN